MATDLSTLTAAIASVGVAIAGVIGALVTWRKASSERTVSEAAIVDDRMRHMDERMDKMQALLDRFRRNERILVDYIYGLQRQVIGLGGNPPPWPRALNDTEENT